MLAWAFATVDAPEAVLFRELAAAAAPRVSEFSGPQLAAIIPIAGATRLSSGP